MQPLTESQVRELLRLESEATPGEWGTLEGVTREYPRAAFNPWYVEHVVVPLKGEPQYRGHKVSGFVAELKDTKEGTVRADAALIAAARNALPQLAREWLAMREAQDRALAHLERIGPPENTCCGDPVCHEQDEWPPERWCDSCLANAARRALSSTEPEDE